MAITLLNDLLNDAFARKHGALKLAAALELPCD
jgi:hypothetical protein